MGADCYARQLLKSPVLLWLVVQFGNSNGQNSSVVGDLEDPSTLTILIVSFVILFLFIIGGIIFIVCRHKRRQAAESLARRTLLDNQAVTAGYFHDFETSRCRGDSPPSYTKCVQSGVISATASFLELIWGDSSSLPDYETVIRSRGSQGSPPEVASIAEEQIQIHIGESVSISDQSSVATLGGGDEDDAMLHSNGVGEEAAVGKNVANSDETASTTISISSENDAATSAG